MRAAILHLAFAGLGADSAFTSAWHDNAPSQGVTRSLGYEPNGWDIQMRRGEPDRMLHFVLTRERWQAAASRRHHHRRTRALPAAVRHHRACRSRRRRVQGGLGRRARARPRRRSDLRACRRVVRRRARAAACRDRRRHADRASRRGTARLRRRHPCATRCPPVVGVPVADPADARRDDVRRGAGDRPARRRPRSEPAGVQPHPEDP